MIADKLFHLFSYKLDVDDREPFLEVDLGGNTLGFFFPSILYWAQALMVRITTAQLSLSKLFKTTRCDPLLNTISYSICLSTSQLIPICSFFAMAMATITYFLIIPRQRSIIAYLIGFGIVIPITTCYFPFMVLDFFDIRNRILRFCVGAVFPVLSMFRTSEAMFGFSPHSVEKSWANYVLYHSAGVGIQFDKNTGRPIRATNKEVLGAIQNFLQLVFILGFYQSIFGPSNYEPYETSINANEQGYNLMDVFDLNLLRNNFISTMLLQLYLYTYLTALTILVTGIMGIKVQEGMMDNPLMKATSPSNFWGGRCNVLIHDSLKRGVFKPVYSVSTKFTAVVATFLASGLFHEYLLLSKFVCNLFLCTYIAFTLFSQCVLLEKSCSLSLFSKLHYCILQYSILHIWASSLHMERTQFSCCGMQE